jgi:hypothetical protein
MSEVTSDTTTTEAARFVGVAVSTYDHDTFTPLPQTVSGVNRVSEILSAYRSDVLSDLGRAGPLLLRLPRRTALPTGGSVIVLWSGHGAAAGRMSCTHRVGTRPRCGGKWIELRGASGDKHCRCEPVLLLFDTCYAGTGSHVSR